MSVLGEKGGLAFPVPSGTKQWGRAAVSGPRPATWAAGNGSVPYVARGRKPARRAAAFLSRRTIAAALDHQSTVTTEAPTYGGAAFGFVRRSVVGVGNLLDVPHTCNASLISLFLKNKQLGGCCPPVLKQLDHSAANSQNNLSVLAGILFDPSKACICCTCVVALVVVN